MKLKKIALLSTLAITIFGSSQVIARDNLKDFVSFLRENGQSAILTEGGKYQSSTQHIYSGGSMSIRTPNYRINPISITTPNIQAGCGGVDLYFGSFSFLKSEELERFARQVIAVAPYFAFKIALSSYSPSIEKVLSSLQSMAQLLSSTQLDACTTAEYSVNTMAELFDNWGSNGAAGTGESKKRNLLYQMKAEGEDSWLNSYKEGAKKIYDAVNNFGPKDDDVNKKEKEKKQKTSDVPIAQDSLKARTTAHEAVTQDDIDEYAKGLAVGNILYTNAHTIRDNLQKRHDSSTDTYATIANLFNNPEDLQNLIYSLYGGVTAKFQGNSMENEPAVTTVDPTITLQQLIEGGELQMLTFVDEVVDGKTYSATKEQIKAIEYISLTQGLMESIGNYDDKAVLGCEEAGFKGTMIAKMMCSEETKFDDIQSVIQAKLLTSKAIVDIGNRATTNPQEASKIAERCLHAYFLELYYKDLGYITLFLNQVVMNASNNIYDNGLRQATRKKINASWEKIEEERNTLLNRYGTPDTCMYKQTGVATTPMSNAK